MKTSGLVIQTRVRAGSDIAAQCEQHANNRLEACIMNCEYRFENERWLPFELYMCAGGCYARWPTEFSLCAASRAIDGI